MIALFASPLAFALGHDIASCALEWEAQSALPALLQDCVHHYGVDDTDVLWFAGDAWALQVRMRGFAALAPLSGVLHSGSAEVRSPWDATPRDIDADWRASLAFDCGRRGRSCRLTGTRLDVWTDGRVDPTALVFPAAVAVTFAPEDLVRLLAP